MTTAFETLEYDVTDRTAWITMSRAPVNAINDELASEINAAYRRAAEDDRVRSIVLTSAFDRAFSGGMDLKKMDGASGQDLREFLETLYFEMHRIQYTIDKPTIAALTGPARAAGVTLAVSCDVIVASETADIAYPEIDVGLIPAMHFVHLPRQIGRHRAFELLFSGESVSATEAEEMGLVNRVVPRNEVESAARDLATTFNQKPPTTMALGRQAFMRAQDHEYRRNIENVVETICNIMDRADAKEGIEAYVEGRDPEW